MTQTEVTPGQRSRRVRVLVLLAILVTLGSCTGLDLWSGRQVETEIARLEARYGSLDEATLLVPAVPPDDNRARIVRAAAALTIPLSDSIYHRVDLRASAPVPADLRAFAEANGSAIRLVDDVRTRAQSNWEIDYTRDRMSWEGIRTLSDAIYVTALMDMEAGRADAASHAIVSGLAVAASLRQEPEIISQLLRIDGFAGRQLRAIQRLVTQWEPSKAPLDDLARWVAENRAPDPMQVALLGELKLGHALVTRLENGQADRNLATYIYPETWPAWGAAWVGPIARMGRPFVRLAHVRYLQHMEHLLDVQSGPRPRPAFQAPPEPRRWELIDRLTCKFTGGHERLLELDDDFISELGATETAVALRRYRLDHGVYPDDLSALVPGYLVSLPIDPYTGRPTAYTRQGAGFTLRAKSSNPNAAAWRALEWSVSK